LPPSDLWDREIDETQSDVHNVKRRLRLKKQEKRVEVKSLNEKLWSDLALEALEDREELSPVVPYYDDPGCGIGGPPPPPPPSKCPPYYP
jgi:hypothetical protein